MDEVTAARFGQPVIIDGTDYVSVESTFLAELGPVTGEGIWLVIFSSAYKPKRGQNAIYRGREYRVSRHQRFNGKWQISLE